ncbi:MAG: T9SS type A sorting domain-containing protein [Winogradskyella sp.]|uniref:aryl-sulfate sulfotransferase n=1 Tax=Winogradskyella sp. TaxID=1883156 RepID=UPI0017C68D2F|nr:aryl-sulfate sulfotransferase [Winogradskyella sp.]NNK21762.1 T9SS type A sorting domain-containing protein [Winogradskyella sp.]
MNRYLLAVLFCSTNLIAQVGTVIEEYPDHTVGMTLWTTNAFEGYTLIAPQFSTEVHLIDMSGRIVNEWETGTEGTGLVTYLLEDGSLLRMAAVEDFDEDFPLDTFPTDGKSGILKRFDWEGNEVWTFNHYSSEYLTHHDVEYLPNGNILLIAWERKTEAEAIAAGRDPNTIDNGYILPEKIIEIEPTGSSGGNIVWEWHVWDHLVQDIDPTKANYGTVSDHPELVDINVVSEGTVDKTDWLHANAVDYNADLDQIIFSVHGFSEFWIIDHSTTTAEAASHSGGRSGKGGDLLYRWGNPRMYGAGDEDDQKLFHQHDAHWIENGLPGAGNILVFNNGITTNHSSADEIAIPTPDINGNYPLVPGEAYAPSEIYWESNPDDPIPDYSFYSRFISSAQRLPNGNTFICSGAQATLTELTSNRDVTWTYINPDGQLGPFNQGQDNFTLGDSNRNRNSMFRSYRYAPSYPAFTGRDLTPGDYIEIYFGLGINEFDNNKFELKQNVPNPFNSTTSINYSLSASGEVEINLLDPLGRLIETIYRGNKERGNHSIEFDSKYHSGGLYFYQLKMGNSIITKKMVIKK